MAQGVAEDSASSGVDQLYSPESVEKFIDALKASTTIPNGDERRRMVIGLGKHGLSEGQSYAMINSIVELDIMFGRKTWPIHT